MTRVQKGIGLGFGLCLVAALGAIWHFAFRTPPTRLLPLRHTAIAIDSEEGRKLLASGLEAWGYHAGRTKLDLFRSVAKDNLQREGDFIVVREKHE